MNKKSFPADGDPEGASRSKSSGWARAFLLLGTGAFAAFLLVLAWLYHSPLLTARINKRLASIPGYSGGITEAYVHPFSGKIILRGLQLEKNEEKAPAAFVRMDEAVVGWSWRELLFSRRWIVTLELRNADATFLMRQRRPGQPRKFALWQPFFAKFPPFRLDRVTISGSRLRIRNDEDIPATNIYFDRINVRGANMANRAALLLPGGSRVDGFGRMMNHAPLRLTVDVEPFRERAAFRLKGRLSQFDLVRLNPVLRHYTGVDIEKGFMTVQGEFTAGQGRFKGSVTRTIEELDVLGKTDRHLGFIQAVKEFVFEFWLNRKKDKETGHLEARYQLNGPLGYMDQDVFLASAWVAKTAFLQSIRPTLPETVNMGTPEQAEEEWMELQKREREKRRQKTKLDN